MIQEVLFAALGLGAGAVLVWVWQRSRSQAGPDTLSHTISFQKTITEQLDRVFAQMDARLRDNVRAMNESKSFLADRVSTTERAVRAVSSSLGKLEEATAALQRTNAEIASFQQMLRSPKVRGSFGEVLLTTLLAEILPAERYRTQFVLPGGTDIADTIIKLQDGYIVAVDAKFPLANYQRYVDESNPAQKAQLHKAFQRDVKKHISDIARKYISPAAKTLDFAFMYIPLEGVYYETIVQDSDGESLWEFCLQHKVIPVSPNSFLAYLQTILLGLRGLQIEQQAKTILQSLSQVRQEFKHFGEEFSMVGKHLSNAKNRFDDTARQLDRVTHRLEQVESHAAQTTLPVEPVELGVEIKPPAQEDEITRARSVASTTGK
jgi:DNA recombination protein RmuC